MEKEEVRIDYETRCKELEERLKYEIDKLNHDWENKLNDMQTTSIGIINTLKEENEFYKNIIKGILHI